VSRSLRVIDNLVCLVHMANGSISQPARLRHILSFGQVIMRRPQQLVRLPEPVMRAQVGIDVERIIQALSVIDRSLLDLIDRRVNLANRRIIVMLHRIPRPSVVQIVPSRTQVAQSVQISRVRSWDLLRLNRHRNRRRNESCR
jgi:hypothetical protein